MQQQLEQAVQAISTIVMGKDRAVRLAVACLLARGHLLIEDLPGMGKTTLAHALARVFGLEYRRVQFTSDLLPADVLGSNVFQQHEGVFQFHPGPVFTQLLLADEINRSTPKTQSALLEAMEERQVSIEGITRPLPVPFFVIATQNPANQYGTFPLPESQLDRFLMRISLGYPDQESERRLLQQGDSRPAIDTLPVCFDLPQLQAAQQLCGQVMASDGVIDYIQRLVSASRVMEGVALGLSPRAALALLHAGKAWALLQGRDYLMPEDIQQVFTEVASHRLLVSTEAGAGTQLVDRLLGSVDLLGAI